MTVDEGPAVTRWTRIRVLAWRALRIELRIYESLWRAIVRRPVVPSGARGFRYHSPVLTVFIVFIALSAVEIPILDLLLHRWFPVRIIVLVIGIGNETNLEIAFERPPTIRLPGLPPRGGAHTVEKLRFWADDPQALLEEVRARLG